MKYIDMDILLVKKIYGYCKVMNNLEFNLSSED